MRQVSVKTLVLLTAAFACAAVCYSTAWTSSVRAGTSWGHAEPNQPQDPNGPVDPNESGSPLPEVRILPGPPLWHSALPADVNDPNQPRPGPPERG
jgi:hypothetical protein